jgi:hypothetical protein
MGTDNMIKKISVLILLSILFCMPFLAFAQPSTQITEPIGTPLMQCDQTLILNKIQTEEQATRKFLVDTLNQKTEAFFSEADKRMAYLEEEYHKQLRNAVIKLSILWASVTTTVMAIFSFFWISFYKRRYRKTKQDMKEDIIKELKQEIAKSTKITETKTKSILDLPQQAQKEIQIAEQQLQQPKPEPLTMEQLQQKITELEAQSVQQKQKKKQGLNWLRFKLFFGIMAIFALLFLLIYLMIKYFV